MQIKIRDLQFGHTSKKKKEKEKESQILMHANELSKSRNKIVKAFKDDIFPSEHLKKSDDAAYDFTLKNINEFIQEIRPIEEKVNLSLFEDFFQSSSTAEYAKMLINIKNEDENKEYVEEIKDRISDLNDRIKQMSDNEKKIKNAKETLEIINKIIDYY